MIVAGKGGVGKTTVAATLALVAARAGLRTLLVDVEATGALPRLFGRSEIFDYHPVTLRPGRPGTGEVTGRTLTPDDALIEYLDTHGLKRVSKRMATTGTLDLVATAIPGIKDILVLGKVKQLEQAAAAGEPGAPELIIVDAPAAGHAVTFLASAHGLLDAIGVGPIRSQASDVAALLADPARCQVLLVTLPEETPVNEVVETAFHLEDRAGVKLGPVVVNGLYPSLTLPEDVVAAAKAAGARLDPQDVAALAGAADFRRQRQSLQAAQVARLAEELPLPQLRLPHLWTTDLDERHLDQLADGLGSGISALSQQPSEVPG
jgi:anion-transporting  ArsA/GET3 family ATPase